VTLEQKELALIYLVRNLLILPLIFLLFTGSASRDFDGDGDFVSTAAYDITDGDYSLSAWFNVNSDTGADDYAVINIGGEPGGTNFIKLRVNQDMKLEALHDSGTTAIFSGDTTIQLDTWYYGVSTYSSGAFNIYLNGVADVSENGDTGDIDSNGTHIWCIGINSADTSCASDRDFDGQLAWAGYNDNQLATWVINEQMWNPEMTWAAYASLLPLWGASTETDLSGNGRTGAVTNATANADGPPIGYGGFLPL